MKYLIAVLLLISVVAHADDPIANYEGSICPDIALSITSHNVVIDSDGQVTGAFAGSISGNCNASTSIVHDDHNHEAPPPPPPPPPSTGVVISGVDLGELPAGVTLDVPLMPVISQTINVSNSSEFSSAISQPGTRVHVTAALSSVTISGTNIEITQAPGASLQNVTIMRGSRQLHFNGGNYRNINIVGPTEGNPQEFVEDVVIQGVTLTNAGGTGIYARGNRIAVLESNCDVSQYCVYANSREGVSNIVIAQNHFVTQGSEANVRLVNMQTSVVVDNYLESFVKHNYRIHGISDNNFFARNTINGASTMISNDSACEADGSDFDHSGSAWYHDNIHYNTNWGSVAAHPYGNHNGCATAHGADFISAMNNTVYSDSGVFWIVSVGGGIPAHWIDQNNQMLPYQAYQP